MIHRHPGNRRGNFFLLAALLFLAACATKAPVSDTQQTRVYALINERLSYMADVAAYKYERQLPVEDLAREAAILESVSQQAASAGLDVASVRPFFEAQFRAAKRIQATVMLELESERRLPGDYRDLATEVRPALDRIGQALIEAIVNSLKAGQKFSEADQPVFNEVVNNGYLANSNREELLAALAGIRLGPNVN